MRYFSLRSVETTINLNIMKPFIAILIASLLFFTANAQTKETAQAKPDPQKKIQIVEAACGECKLGLKGATCNLAVRIEGKCYFVDGTDIDSQGDAHARDGFCAAVRTAEVQGEIVNNRFKASYFKLIEEPKDKRKLREQAEN
jgi:hypothetical protein